jgi:hypothetical protein
MGCVYDFRNFALQNCGSDDSGFGAGKLERDLLRDDVDDPLDQNPDMVCPARENDGRALGGALRFLALPKLDERHEPATVLDHLPIARLFDPAPVNLFQACDQR